MTVQTRRGALRMSALLAFMLSVAASAQVGSAPASAGPPAAMAACPIFPADSFWHADVRSLPVHDRSAAWLAAMGGSGRFLHPDFGPSGEAQPYGIPYAVVGADHQRVNVTFEYEDESDAAPYPFGPDIPIEGGSESDGDRHALMLDRDACVLSELFAADWNGGQPMAGSGAIFDLRSNALRPSGWTSADAAGLAIFPGLLRLDEVKAGNVDHVVRVTARRTDRTFIWPARHHAGAARDANLPPMGAWFRLKGDYSTSGLRPETRVILDAFKTHGLIVADNGSDWFFTGAADDGWDTAVLDELKRVPAGAFEAVDTSSMMVDPNSGQVRAASAGTPASPTPGGAPPVTQSPATTARRVAATTAKPAPAATAAPAAPTTVPTTAPVETTNTSAAENPTTTTDASESAAQAPAGRRPIAKASQSRGPLLVIGLAALACAAGCCGLIALLARRRRQAGDAGS